MVEHVGEVKLLLDRRMTSKSRPVPAILRHSVQDEGERTSKNEVDFKYQLQLFNDPSEDLIESYIAAVAREALRGRQSDWDTSSSFGVDIRLGSVEGASSADVDNITKLLLDGLTGVLWDADSQVIDSHTVQPPTTGKRIHPTVVKVWPIADVRDV